MVFGLFSKERSLQRAMKKAQNKLAQSPDRWAAMERLRKVGTEECLLVVLKRFSFTSTKLVEDQQEKDWVVESMIALGERAMPALTRHLSTADQLSYPLRILEGIATPKQAGEVIDKLISDDPPGYTRDANKKTDIINWLGEYTAMPASDVVRRIAPYLEDFDENVRFSVVESISLRPTPEAAEPLVKALLNEEEESQRLRKRIAEVLSEGEMDLCGRKSDVSALFDDLLSEYKLHRNKLVRKIK